MLRETNFANKTHHAIPPCNHSYECRHCPQHQIITAFTHISIFVVLSRHFAPHTLYRYQVAEISPSEMDGRELLPSCCFSEVDAMTPRNVRTLEFLHRNADRLSTGDKTGLKRIDKGYHLPTPPTPQTLARRRASHVGKSGTAEQISRISRSSK